MSKSNARVFESTNGTAIWGPVTPHELSNLVRKAQGHGHCFPDVRLAQQIGALMVWRVDGPDFAEEVKGLE